MAVAIGAATQLVDELDGGGGFNHANSFESDAGCNDGAMHRRRRVRVRAPKERTVHDLMNATMACRAASH